MLRRFSWHERPKRGLYVSPGPCDDPTLSAPGTIRSWPPILIDEDFPRTVADTLAHDLRALRVVITARSRWAAC